MLPWLRTNDLNLVAAHDAQTHKTMVSSRDSESNRIDNNNDDFPERALAGTSHGADCGGSCGVSAPHSAGSKTSG